MASVDLPSVPILGRASGDLSGSYPSPSVIGGTSPIFQGNVTMQKIVGSGSVSITAGTGAGGTPTVSVSGNNVAGLISVSAGAVAATDAAVVTVSFSSAYPVAPRVILTPVNIVTAALAVASQVCVISSTTGFEIHSNAVGLGAVSYAWNYMVCT